MLWIILLIALVLILIASVPVYPYSRNWGYAPGSILLILLVIFVVLLIAGVIDINIGDNNTDDLDAEINHLRIEQSSNRLLM